jgi:endoglucanase
LEIAYELYLASQQWHNPAYLTASTQIIKDLWRYCVLQINHQLYLMPSTNSFYAEANAYLVNPSYYDPLAFKTFAKIDPDHPWEQLVVDTYDFLSSLQDNAIQPALPPNWVLIEIDTGQKRPTYGIIAQNADDYGYDAFRTFYRVASDYFYTKDARARDYLSAYQPFFEAEMATHQKISAIYSVAGHSIMEHDSISTAVGAWSVLQVVNSPQANQIYQKYFVDSYHDTGYYGDAQNYYDQNWAAFASQLHYLLVKQKERGDRP